MKGRLLKVFELTGLKCDKKLQRIEKITALSKLQVSNASETKEKLRIIIETINKLNEELN